MNMIILLVKRENISLQLGTLEFFEIGYVDCIAGVREENHNAIQNISIQEGFYNVTYIGRFSNSPKLKSCQ